ncbi:MAG: ProP [Bacillota bacterium]|nr:ProP [Bacillota bacterium]
MKSNSEELGFAITSLIFYNEGEEHMKKQVRRGFGKGWVLILYAFLAYFTATAVGSAMNVAAGTLSDLRGWSSTLLTSFISLGSIANIVAGFVFGRLSINHSAKKLSILCSIVYIAALIGLGLTSQIWIFAACLIIANGISCALGYQLSPVIISKWFPKRKGMIMGIVTMGIPFCAGVASLIYNAGYSKFGSVGGFSGFMIVAAAAMIILALFITDDPAKVGYVPDNGVEAVSETDKVIHNNSIWTTGKLLRTPQVWIHGIALGFQLTFASGLMVQLVPRLLELGYNINTAATMMIASGLLACVGSYICGLIDQKVGARRAAYTSYIFGAVAMFTNLTGTTVGVWISLVCIGMVVGGAANWPASLCIELFGENFANGYGVIQPIIQLVGAVGPAFFALIAGSTGGYRIPYLAGAGLMIIGLLMFALLAKSDFVKKEEAKYMNA